MNRNNLNWTDNRVLGAAGAATPKPNATGVSPAQYEAPKPNPTGVSPATYQNTTNSGVSPATYQNANNMGVSPATYQKMDTSSGMPAGYPDTGAMPAPWQDMTGAPTTGVSPTGVSPTGVSPTGVSPTGVSPVFPGTGMQSAPTEPMMMESRNDTRGTVTRNGSYAPMPIIDEPGPPSVMDPGYIPGYLRTQIGKRIRAEFVFENLFLDKTGILRDVGYNYFVLQDNATGAMIMCDLYSARFITSV
jgi:hypothetical protein